MFSVINNLTSRIKINTWKPIENCMFPAATTQEFIMCKMRMKIKRQR